MRFALAAIVPVWLLLLLAAPAYANAPAPWWACLNKAVGEKCERYGGANGLCAREAECTDNPGTEVDECLYCQTSGSGCSTVSGSGTVAAGGLLSLVAAMALARRRRAAAPSPVTGRAPRRPAAPGR